MVLCKDEVWNGEEDSRPGPMDNSDQVSDKELQTSESYVSVERDT